MVNIAGAGTGTHTLSATTSNFKSGDKIELKFNSGTPGTTTLDGWTAKIESSNVILTKDN